MENECVWNEVIHFNLFVRDMMPLLLNLLKALFATVLIEESAAIFWKERSLRLALAVLVANLVTNPLLNVIILVAPDAWVAEERRYDCLVCILEGCVWLSEAWWFNIFGRIRPTWRALFFSLVLNVASYFSAYPLEKLGYWG